ncbi:hypothetical protein [Helicobacter sp. 23-1045]
MTKKSQNLKAKFVESNQKIQIFAESTHPLRHPSAMEGEKFGESLRKGGEKVT